MSRKEESSTEKQALFIDVDSTCATSMNTGIQRVVRGLCRNLPQRLNVIPVMWHRRKSRYIIVRSGSREDRLLRVPFAGGESAVADPQQRAAIVKPFIKLIRSVRKMTASLADSRTFGTGTCWLEPEIFLDKRMAYWERGHVTMGRRVAIFYDATPLQEPTWVEDSFRRKFVRYMETLARFDCVIAISHESADDLRDFWNSRGIQNAGIRVEELPCDFASGPRNATPNAEAAKILVVASLEPRKNHATFLDACEILWREGARFAVELVGRYPKETGAPVLARIEEVQKAGRPLEWRKHISDGDLLECYRESSFTVYPSFKEGLGLPVLESLWHGRPCVCGSNGALGEVSAGGGCVTVDQRNPVSLAAGMKSLLSDRDVYRRRYDEAMRRAFRTWEEYSAAIASIVSEPAQTRNPGVR